ncbi:hypothetical protein HJG60_008119 [Phyllostomus discolor]|uniref:Uncharacterized protein n=1 Tax=Phyllostomus discolor TaxID=89673 RepID=A0A833Z199_9CHIR|nr:hypothetical protein HJG60_008119 [Phyllostomus discolor]
MTTFGFAGLRHPCMSCDIIPRLATLPRTLRTKDWQISPSGPHCLGHGTALPARHKPVTEGALGRPPPRTPHRKAHCAHDSTQPPATRPGPRRGAPPTPCRPVPTSAPQLASLPPPSWAQAE